MLHEALIWLGLASLLYPLLKTIYKCLKYAYCQKNPIDLPSYGSWAIVTGASDGIGKAYALELAKRGLNILIISRTEAKLAAVCNEAKARFNVEADYIAFDFDKDTYDELKIAIQHKDYFQDIGILVNNVGVLPYAYDCYYDRTKDFEKLQKMVGQNYRINIKAQALMTAIVLPQFYENKKGILVHLSSVSATVPQPFWTLYSCAKAVNTYFSESLRKEFEFDQVNIISQTVRPAIVLTSMAPKFAKESYRFPTAETFCSWSVSTIGYFSVTNGYWYHSLMCFVMYNFGVAEKLIYGRVKKIRASRERRAKKQ